MADLSPLLERLWRKTWIFQENQLKICVFAEKSVILQNYSLLWVRYRNMRYLKCKQIVILN